MKQVIFFLCAFVLKDSWLEDEFGKNVGRVL